MTEQEIAKLRAAGFTDADIEDYKANEVQTPTGGPAVPDSSLPEVDVNQPSETLKNAQAGGAPTTNPGSWTTDALAIGQGLLPSSVGDTLMKVGEGALAYQGIKGWRESSAARQAQAAAELAREQGIAQRAAQKAGQQVAQQGVRGAGQQVMNQMGQQLTRAPVTGPAVPTGAPVTGPVAPAAPVAQQPSMMQRGATMANNVRQAAAQRIAGLGQAVAPYAESAGNMLGRAAPYAARAAGAVGAAVTPGNIGQNYNFPTTGPLRGSEINPRTGRPWTGQELAAYKQQYGG